MRSLVVTRRGLGCRFVVDALRHLCEGLAFGRRGGWSLRDGDDKRYRY
ncbi:hypothetical protein HMPREF3223_00320 [Cutibacterium avidum]|nr:hypothetical protein HMPREF3223_00320 [Cutibacterium avidum]